LPLVAGGSACTALNVSAPGNAADVRLDLAGYDHDRGALHATLAHGGRTVTAFDAGTFSSDEGVFSLRGQPIGGLGGSAGGEWQLCVFGTEPRGGSGTLDTWSVHD
jgi:hypothetical protein